MVTVGMLDAAPGADGTGLGHAGGQVTGQEGSLVGLEGQAAHIVHDRGGTAILAFNRTGIAVRVGVVDDGELLVGVGFGSRGGIHAHQEADGDDQVILLADQLLDVLGVVGLLVGFEDTCRQFPAVICLLDTLPAQVVEGLVIDAAGIGDHANTDLGEGRVAGCRGSRSLVAGAG